MLKDCIEQVEFLATKLKHPQLVWLDKTVYEELSVDNEINNVETRFLDDYAFSTETELVTTELLAEQKKTFTAERYGGSGIGTNGGGARCGNIGNIQVKGIGANPLASSKSDLLHRYGGLNLHDAVYECISSTVLNNVLPLGCVNCFGIVLTGQNTAYPPYEGVETTKGALLMREVTARPAHFLPAPHFEPNDKQNIYNDMYRLRKSNKLLAQSFNSQNDLILYFGKFLQNCANQFAFAKVFRIYHGTITPSNIAIDGRWLDLTTSSFIESDKNYYFTPHNPPFFDEHTTPGTIIKEVLYQCGKFNLVDFNVEILTQYYEEQYQAYFNHHFAKVLGLPDDIDAKVTSSKSYKLLIEAFSALLLQNNQLEKFTYKHSVDSDSLEKLLTGWFKDINDDEKLRPDSLSYSLNVVVKSFYRSIKNNRTSIKAFKISQSIKALRRLYYRPFFYSGHIQAGLRKDIESNEVEIDYFGQLIESYREISAWAFSSLNDTPNTIIFKHKQVAITFDVNNHCYQVNINKAVTMVNTPDEVKALLNTIDDELLTINYFNFKAPILKLLKTLG